MGRRYALFRAPMVLAAIVFIATQAEQAQAAERRCAPPAGFTPSPMPQPDASTRFVSHEESVDIPQSLSRVMAIVAATDLQDAIQDSDLPGVAGTFDLTPGGFGSVGSRRLTCLTDGSTLVEQVLATSDTPTRNRFQYAVWDYTSKNAAPVLYSIGDFDRIAVDGEHTRTRWTYSFVLRDDRFPGRLGAFGRWAFRVFFLDRSYAKMMAATLAAEKRAAEQRAGL